MDKPKNPKDVIKLNPLTPIGTPVDEPADKTEDPQETLKNYAESTTEDTGQPVTLPLSQRIAASKSPDEMTDDTKADLYDKAAVLAKSSGRPVEEVARGIIRHQREANDAREQENSTMSTIGGIVGEAGYQAQGAIRGLAHAPIGAYNAAMEYVSPSGAPARFPGETALMDTPYIPRPDGDQWLGHMTYEIGKFVGVVLGAEAAGVTGVPFLPKTAVGLERGLEVYLQSSTLKKSLSLMASQRLGSHPQLYGLISKATKFLTSMGLFGGATDAAIMSSDEKFSDQLQRWQKSWSTNGFNEFTADLFKGMQQQVPSGLNIGPLESLSSSSKEKLKALEEFARDYPYDKLKWYWKVFSSVVERLPTRYTEGESPILGKTKQFIEGSIINSSIIGAASYIVGKTKGLLGFTSKLSPEELAKIRERNSDFAQTSKDKTPFILKNFQETPKDVLGPSAKLKPSKKYSPVNEQGVVLPQEFPESYRAGAIPANPGIPDVYSGTPPDMLPPPIPEANHGAPFAGSPGYFGTTGGPSFDTPDRILSNVKSILETSPKRTSLVDADVAAGELFPGTTRFPEPPNANLPRSTVIGQDQAAIDLGISGDSGGMIIEDMPKVTDSLPTPEVTTPETPPVTSPEIYPVKTPEVSPETTQGSIPESPKVETPSEKIPEAPGAIPGQSQELPKKPEKVSEFLGEIPGVSADHVDALINFVSRRPYDKGLIDAAIKMKNVIYQELSRKLQKDPLFTKSVPKEAQDLIKWVNSNLLGSDDSLVVKIMGEQFDTHESLGKFLSPPKAELIAVGILDGTNKDTKALISSRVDSPISTIFLRPKFMPSDITHEIGHKLWDVAKRLMPKEVYGYFETEYTRLFKEYQAGKLKKSAGHTLDQDKGMNFAHNPEEFISQQLAKAAEYDSYFSKSPKVQQWFQSFRDSIAQMFTQAKKILGWKTSDVAPEKLTRDFLKKLGKLSKESSKANAPSSLKTLSSSISESLSEALPKNKRGGFIGIPESVVGFVLPKVVQGLVGVGSEAYFQHDFNGDGHIDAEDFVLAGLGAIAIGTTIQHIAGLRGLPKAVAGETSKALPNVPIEIKLSSRAQDYTKGLTEALENVKKAISEAETKGESPEVLWTLNRDREILERVTNKMPKTVQQVREFMKPGTVLGDHIGALQKGAERIQGIPNAEFNDLIKKAASGDSKALGKIFKVDPNTFMTPEGIQSFLDNMRQDIGELFTEHHVVIKDADAQAKAIQLWKDNGWDIYKLGELVQNTKGKSKDLHVQTLAIQMGMDLVDQRLIDLATKPKGTLTVTEQLEVRTILTQINALHSHVRDIGSDSGRNLRAMQNSSWFRTNNPEELRSLLETMGGPEGTERILEYVRNNKGDRVALQKYARLSLYNPYFRPILGIMYNSMLSSVWTHTFNFAANTSFLAGHIGEQVLGGLMGGSRESVGSALAYIQGITGGFVDSFGTPLKKAFWDSVETAKNFKYNEQPLKGEARIGGGGFVDPAAGPIGATIQRGLHAAETASRVYNGDPMRWLTAADTFNKSITYGAKYMQLTYEEAVAFTKANGGDFFENFKKLYDTPNINKMNLAAEHAEQMTLTSRLPQALRELNVARTGDLSTVGQLFIPFFKTSANAVLETLDRIPALKLLQPSFYQTLSKGGLEAREAMAKFTMGGLFLSAAYHLAATGKTKGDFIGKVRGSYPDQFSPKTANAIQPQDTISINGRYIPLKYLGVVGSVLKFGANVHDMIQFASHPKFNRHDLTLDTPDFRDWMMSMATVTMNHVAEPGFIEGLQTIVSLTNIGRMDSNIKSTEDVFAELASRFQPAWMANTRDLHSFLTDGETRLTQGTYENLMSKFPGMAKEYPVKRTLMNTPIDNRHEPLHPIYRELYSFGVDIGGIQKNIRKAHDLPLDKRQTEKKQKLIAEYLKANFPKTYQRVHSSNRKLTERDKHDLYTQMLGRAEDYAVSKLMRDPREAIDLNQKSKKAKVVQQLLDQTHYRGR